MLHSEIESSRVLLVGTDEIKSTLAVQHLKTIAAMLRCEGGELQGKACQAHEQAMEAVRNYSHEQAVAVAQEFFTQHPNLYNRLLNSLKDLQP